MRKFIVLIVAVVSVGFLADALAETIEPIKGTVTPVALGRACSGAGGSFDSNATGYSCEKENCDGKGGKCGVYCESNGKCVGTTPSRTKPGTGRPSAVDLNSVLTNKVRKQTGSPANPVGGAASPPSGSILGSDPGLSGQGPSRTGTGTGKPGGSGTIY